LYIESPDTPASLSAFAGGRRQEMKITFILTLDNQTALSAVLTKNCVLLTYVLGYQIIITVLFKIVIITRRQEFVI